MHPAVVAIVGLVAFVLGLVIGLLQARARARRLMEQHVDDQLASVQLYLKRKVAEHGLDPPTVTTSRELPGVLRDNHLLAKALLDHERKQIEMGDTQEFGLASTMRLQTPTDIAVPEVVDTQELKTRDSGELHKRDTEELEKTEE